MVSFPAGPEGVAGMSAITPLREQVVPPAGHLLGHSRIDTTEVYASIRPAQVKRAVAFYEEDAMRMLTT